MAARPGPDACRLAVTKTCWRRRRPHSTCLRMKRTTATMKTSSRPLPVATARPEQDRSGGVTSEADHLATGGRLAARLLRWCGSATILLNKETHERRYT